MVLWVGLQCVFVVFPDHSHLLLGLKTLLQQGISERVYILWNLVYKFKRIVRNRPFMISLKRSLSIIKGGYKMDSLRQSACLVVNPITVYSYGFLLNCTMVGQGSDSMTTPIFKNL